MGYTREHREETRRRILESAGKQFRQLGYERAKIDEIMTGAGLTRGGFYLHFRSKQDLFAAAIAEELEFTKELRRGEERIPDDPRAGAAVAIDYYLAPENREKIARGCIVVSNAADIARSRKPARRAFTRSFRELAHEFERLVEDGIDARSERGLAALATCIGGVVLARALADEALIEELLDACRTSAMRTLGDDA